MEHIGKILIVDDEVNVTHALARLLRRHRWQVVTAASAEAGQEVLSRERDFTVILSDHRMPGENGVSFLTSSRERCPEASRLLLTGYADIYAALDAINRGAVFRFLVKPWKDDELLATLEQAREQSELVTGHRLLTAELAEKNGQLERLNGALEVRVQERTAEIEALSRDLQASLLGAIRAMGASGERKSPGLGGHGRRMAALAGQLARGLRLGAAATFRAQAAAYLHLIGGAEGEASRFEEAAKLIEMVPHMEGVAALVRKLGGPAESVEPTELEVLRVADAFERALSSPNAPKKADPAAALQALEGNKEANFPAAVLDELRRHLVASNQLNAELYEQRIASLELREGMVLSRGLSSRNGHLLLARGTRISLEHIQGMWSRAEREQPADDAYVLRDSVKAAKAA